MTDTEIDLMLMEADRAWNVMAVTKAFMAIIASESGPRTFSDIEDRLRKLNSRIYLVALPKHLFPRGLHCFNVFGRFEIRTWLWIGLNGEAEQKQKLAEIGATEADNLRGLMTCGVAAVLAMRTQ